MALDVLAWLTRYRVLGVLGVATLAAFVLGVATLAAFVLAWRRSRRSCWRGDARGVRARRGDSMNGDGSADW